MSQPDGVIVYSGAEATPPETIKIEFFNDAVETVTDIDCNLFKANEPYMLKPDGDQHLDKKFKFLYNQSDLLQS